MQLVQKLPWISIMLLLLTHGVFGWLVSADYTSWLLWLISAVFILLVAFVLASPVKLSGNLVASWIKSDNRASITTIIGSFLAVLILCWIHIFIRFLVLISAMALVRLDLQAENYNNGWLAFGILAIVSLSGFFIGLMTHQLLSMG
ncbi:MAG: hypothetical protein F6K36_15565 [Symploca sp. SIO3C6]|uniref:Uncharacterized protein n=1 Tax=Symploca sp. SIO1C4 TaxID=2607765 RepID=A0A6B3NFX3_9CYAN|nr:hypothetical protein [Symploca sp. SIO3C6]NER30563.1 hypothetical protein [Symploca sp. SIO1C4]NET04567.1 hypothetical protein [Symploca sp. SIO2B6]NET52148.1 hypothetical protein [Merismopedia sp. SIO2A8]